MTTIAFDGVTLAADKQATIGNMKRTCTKVHEINGLQVAVSGQLTTGLALIEWVRNGRDPADFPEDVEDEENGVSAYLIVIENKQVIVYEASPIPIFFEDTYFASGSGKDFALAAMESGKTAEEAILIASKYDIFTGMGVDVIPC